MTATATVAAPEVPETLGSRLRRGEQLGREESLAAGLRFAVRTGLSGLHPAAAAPGSVVALAADDVPPGLEPRPHHLAGYEGVAFVAIAGERPAAGSAAAEAQVEVARLLAAARAGLVRDALDRAVQHLSGRTTGEEPLLNQQLVTGDLGDVLADLELVAAAVAGADGPAAVAELHTRLDDAGWRVMRLFGGAGYLSGGPGRALYVANLAASTWIDRSGRKP